MRKALIASGITLVAGTVLIGGVYQSLLIQLYHRFPEYDRKIVRKTYREMMVESFKGSLPVKQTMSDAEMDALFIKEYNANILHAV